jgi:hypothetical protein
MMPGFLATESDFESFEVGITMPSLLWRYTNCLRPDRHRSRGARL